MGYLYRFEAKRIQRWILSTDRLKELRGASALIDGLGRWLLDAALKDHAADAAASFAGAGSATIAFASREHLENFAAQVPMFVSHFAPDLQFVQAWVEGTSTADLHTALQAQRAFFDHPLPVVGPLVARSGRSGRPAVARSNGELLDAATRQKLRALKGVGGDAVVDDDDTQILGITEVIQGLDFELEEDLEKFPDSYVAVVHADGNGVGERFIKAGASAQALSEALTKITKDCVRDALSEVRGALWHADEAFSRRPIVVGGDDSNTSGKLSERCNKFPCRPIVVGGDDMTVVIAASLALPFVHAYLRAFEQKTAAELSAFGGKMTAKAGVAFVKKHWPFSQAHDLAADLADHAKGDGSESRVAFHRVTTALARDYKSILLEERRADGNRSLTAAPYTLDQLEALAELTQSFDRESFNRGGIPRGPVRTWVADAMRSDTEARQRWERMRVVLSNDGKRSGAWRRFECALAAFGAMKDGPWFKRPPAEEGDPPGLEITPVYDALEWKVLQPAAGCRLAAEYNKTLRSRGNA